MSDLLPNLKVTAELALVRRHGAEYGSLLKNRALLDQLRSGARGQDPEATRSALREVSTEFESIFLNQLVTAMRKTVGEAGLIEKGNAERMFEGMLDEEWSRTLAGRHGPGGLSAMIYRELSRRMGLAEEETASTRRGDTALPSPDRHPLLQLPVIPPPRARGDGER